MEEYKKQKMLKESKNKKIKSEFQESLGKLKGWIPNNIFLDFSFKYKSQ